MAEVYLITKSGAGVRVSISEKDLQDLRRYIKNGDLIDTIEEAN